MDKAKTYALSNDDIQEILEPDTKIWVYPMLRDVRKIDEVFDSLGRMIMLYPTDSPTSGHWVCMIKRGDEIEYFDPYGLPPEAPKKWIGKEQNIILGTAVNLLTQLLKESGYKVIYSTFPYQKMDGSTATCGRWSITRLFLKDYSLEKFHEMIQKSKIQPDLFATAYTYQILGK